jgi:hypothetical protein
MNRYYVEYRHKDGTKNTYYFYMNAYNSKQIRTVCKSIYTWMDLITVEQTD